MNSKINRTLFWFTDGDEQMTSLNNRYYCIANLFNRLMNEVYDGIKIEFVNINFNSEKTYDLYPDSPKDNVHFYAGHLTYDAVFDFNTFGKLDQKDQNLFIWSSVLEILKKAASFTKNKALLKAVEYSYEKGLEIDLNPDFRLIESDVILFEKEMKASVWVNFIDDNMYSKFTLESEKVILFEKHIDKTKTGIEFFLDMYKRIELDTSDFTIIGHKDVPYLPLKISLSEIKKKYIIKT